MLEQEVDVASADGAMNAFFVRPEAGGPYAPVVMLMDAPGLREGLRKLARRLATSGYAVLLPNLFYRIGRVVEAGPTRNHPDAESNLKAMLARVRTLSNEIVTRDIGAALDALSAREDVRRGRAGLVGYCMSGAFAIAAAASLPDRVACAASYYGTKLVTDAPDSPHLAASRVKGELYFAFAEHDPYVPLASVEQLRAHLATTEVPHQIEIYPDTDHGFVFEDRGSYQADAAERHWETLLGLLRRNLVSATEVRP